MVTVPTEKERVMGMYESPIRIIESTIDSFSKAIIKQKDDAIFAEVQSSFGVDVDREELIRALQYDRDQYNKGYADGKRDAEADLVRCKDCIGKAHWYKNDYGCTICGLSGLYVVEDNDFCSYGERREGE